MTGTDTIAFVYFDIGGVFLDWKNYFRTASAAFGIPRERIDAVYDTCDDDITRGRMTPAEFWTRCCSDLHIKNGAGFDFLGSWVDDYEPITPMHGYVRKLRETTGIGIGLISNIYAGMLPLLVSRGKIPDIPYDVTILSCDVGWRKPEREIYELALSKCGHEPSRILFVDDSEKPLAAARDMGWRTLLFDTAHPEDSLAALGMLVPA